MTTDNDTIIRAIAAGPVCAETNPFVLLGPKGSGKTMLLQTIKRLIAEKNDGRRMLFVTMEEFRLQYIAAMKGRKLGLFRAKMREAEVLIVAQLEDAILGCCIQEELIALMTDYLDAGKQIVVASKVPLSQIRGCSCTNIRMARLARGKTLVLAPCDHMCVND